MPSAALPLATRRAATAASALQLAKRDAASLRRAHQQAASRRAPASSTHARPALPSETSSSHLVHRGRVSAHIGGGKRAQAGRREFVEESTRISAACLPSEEPVPPQKAPSSAVPSGDAGDDGAG